MSFSNWPEDDTLVARILRNDPDALSRIEILSILLQSKKNPTKSFSLAGRLLKEFKSFSNIGQRSVRELMNVSGMSPLEVARLKAMFEIVNHLLSEHIIKLGVIKSSYDAVNFLRPLLTAKETEHFMGVLLDAKNQIIKTITFSKGGRQNAVIPIREVIHQLLNANTARVIFAHNHPSGDCRPSREDMKLTRQLSYVCQMVDIMMQDHLIIGEQAFYSFSKRQKTKY